jgi:hypothetical protein
VEHEALVVERGTELHPVLEHRLAVHLEHGDGRRVEGDRATASKGLRFTDRHLASDPDDRLHEVERPGPQRRLGGA